MAKIALTISLPSVPDEFKDLSEVKDFLEDLVSAIYDPIDSLQDEFNGKVEIINQLIKEISVADTGSADTEFTVTHSLGRIPTYYWYTIDKAGIVYDSRRTSWSTSVMYLKCNQANAALKLAIPL